MFYSKNDSFQGENLQKRLLFVKVYVLKELVLEKELHQFSFLSPEYTQIQSFFRMTKRRRKCFQYELSTLIPGMNALSVDPNVAEKTFPISICQTSTLCASLIWNQPRSLVQITQK